MKTLFNETSITLGRKAQSLSLGRVGTITHVRGTCQDDLVTVMFDDGTEDKFVSSDLVYYTHKTPVFKMSNFRFKFWDADESYFVFAPVIYDLNRNRVAIGLELLGVRVFYFEYKKGNK